MGIKIKNLQTGEFEKFNIPALKGEKGEPGEIEPSEKVDYIGKQHSKLRDTMNANVDYIIKTAIGEFNYLDYEGQHITATNSIEGHARSAILSGQTLVNLKTNSTIKKKNISSLTESKGTMTWDTNSAWGKIGFVVQGKANTKYCVMFSDKLETVGIYVRLSDNIDGGNAMSPIQIKPGFRTFTTNDTGVFICSLEQATPTKGNWIKDFMIIEYQEGMEDWDIPYFTGMQSVKMPVLTTTGKNLFNESEKIEGYIGANSSKEQLLTDVKNTWTTPWIKAKTNTSYTIQGGNRNRWQIKSHNNVITFMDKKTITTLSDTEYIRCYYCNETYIASNVQLEESSSATSYEPYKTNTLHTPKEVVLRSLPNGVCDTLNVETGEYVQRIDEVVLNGNNNESWNVFTGSGGLKYFRIPCPTMTENNQERETPKFLIADKINFGKYKYLYESTSIPEDVVGASTKSNSLGVQCLYVYYKNINVINTFKQYLQQNPITVQYELATPIIKTVDLSDNHVYSYKGTTHYSCSSEEGSLVPTLSVKVPTDTQLTIQEQKATTQTLLIKNMDLQQSIKEVQAMNLAFNTALYNSFNSIREEVEDIKKHVSTNENLEGSF